MADTAFLTWPFLASGANQPAILADRLGDCFNAVRDFGCVGDNTYDNQPNIQAMFDEAFGPWNGAWNGYNNRKLNKVCYFPPGQYSTRKPLYLNHVQGGLIYGQSATNTMISGMYPPGIGNAPGNAIFPLVGGVPTVEGAEVSPVIMMNHCSHIRFKGISISSNDWAEHPSGGAAPFVQAGIFYTWDGTGDAGIATACIFEDCNFSGVYSGFLGGYAGSGGNCENLLFYNCHFDNIARYGLRVGHANALNYAVFGGGASSIGMWTGDTSPGGGPGAGGTKTPVYADASGYSTAAGTLSPIVAVSCSGNVWDIHSGPGNMLTWIGGSSESYGGAKIAGSAILSGVAFRGFTNYPDNKFIDLSLGGTAVLDACQYGTANVGPGKIIDLGNNATAIVKGMIGGGASGGGYFSGTTGSRLYIQGCDTRQFDDAFSGFTGSLHLDGSGVLHRSINAADTIGSSGAGSFAHFADFGRIPGFHWDKGGIVRLRALVRVTTAGAGTSTLTTELRMGAFGTFGTTVLATTTAVDPTASGDFHLLEFELTSRAKSSATTPVVGSGRWSTNTGGAVVNGTSAIAPVVLDLSSYVEFGVWAKWSADNSSTCRLETFSVEFG
jgi:Pectate lyase superfamily protein